MFANDVISVVAGGWSVKTIDLERIPGTILGVNDAALHLPRCDAVVSMDRLWTEHRYGYLRETHKPAWLRRSAVQNIDTKFPWLHVFDCDYEALEFSSKPGWLNGSNSGMCAFNLAYQWRPKELYLFGFDMQRGPNGQAHWYPNYPWTVNKTTSTGKLKEWSRQYALVDLQCKAQGIKVYNASPRSLIATFENVAAKFMRTSVS